MHMKSVLKFVAIAVLSAVAVSPLLAQSNPLLGIWKLNVAKSTFDSAMPAPKSQTRTVMEHGDSVMYMVEGVGADGKPISYSFTVKYDGKDYPVTGTMPGGADMVSIKRVDANNYEATLKKAGKVVGTSKVVISPDGKVTTLTAKIMDASGKSVTATSVYYKQ
jgi:hypothetical protein